MGDRIFHLITTIVDKTEKKDIETASQECYSKITATIEIPHHQSDNKNRNKIPKIQTTLSENKLIINEIGEFTCDLTSKRNRKVIFQSGIMSCKNSPIKNFVYLGVINLGIYFPLFLFKV